MRGKSHFLFFFVIVLSLMLFVSCPESETPPEPVPQPNLETPSEDQTEQIPATYKSGTIRLTIIEDPNAGESSVAEETEFSIRFNKTNGFEPMKNYYKDKKKFYGRTQEFVCLPTEYILTIEYEDSSRNKKTICKNVQVIENSVTEVSVSLSEFSTSEKVSGYVFIDTPDNEQNNGLMLFLAGTAYYAETDSTGHFSFNVPEVSDNVLVVKRYDSYLVLDNATNKAWDYLVPQDDIENSDIVFSGSFSESPEEEVENLIYYNSNEKKLYCYSNGDWQEFKCREHVHNFDGHAHELDNTFHYNSPLSPCECKYCVEIKEHYYIDKDSVVTLQPTCVSDGERRKDCIYCDHYVTEIIEKTGIHDYQFKEYKTEPTCTEAGEEVRKCSVCGNEEIIDVAAKGHTMVDGVCTTCSYTEEIKNSTLVGSFSVSENLRVQFSKGNLYCSDSQWGFENNQYDYRMLPGEKAFINAVVTTTKEDDYGFFHWSKNIEEATDNNYTYNNYSADRSIDDVFFAQNNNAIGSEWRNLTREEVEYLFSRKKDAYNYMFGPATLTVNSSEIKGLILLPDGWQKPNDISFNYYTNGTVDEDFSLNLFSEQQWEILESSDCVFLPAVLQDSEGKDCLFFWTASPQTSEYHSEYYGNTTEFQNYAHFFTYFFNSPYYYMGYGVSARFLTFPVRLVKEVN